MLRSFRNHFQLAATVVACISTIVAIAPFAVLRALAGEWVVAVLDMSIVVGLATILIYSCRTKQVRHSSVLITGLYTIAAILVTQLHMHSTIHWLYPVYLANFFILRIWHATLMNSLALLVVISLYPRFESFFDFMGIFAPMLLANIFAGLYSWKVLKQRRLLRAQASTDLMNQVATRKQMAEALSELVAQKKTSSPVSLVLLEIDHLDSISENFGYEVSDAVLGQAAHLLKGRLRAETDEIFRYSSTILLLLLRNTPENEAVNVASSLEKLFPEQLEGPEGPVNILCSCAEMATDDAWETCTQTAELLLEQRKASREIGMPETERGEA